LSELRFLPSDSAETFAERATELYRKLTDAGDNTTETEIVALVVRRLPAQFESMRAAHIMLGKTNMDLDELLTKLSTAEMHVEPKVTDRVLLASQLTEGENAEIRAYAAYVKRRRLNESLPERSSDRGRVSYRYDHERSGDRGRGSPRHDRRSGSRDRVSSYQDRRQTESDQEGPSDRGRVSYRYDHERPSDGSRVSPHYDRRSGTRDRVFPYQDRRHCELTE
jgi:gag-polypeptide of LTR copia-type